MKCKPVLRAIILSSALLVTGVGHAQGSSPKRTPNIVTTIDLGEVVRRSPFIFRAKVNRVAHTYGVARNTGRRYTRHHRVVVEVVTVIRGADGLKGYLDNKEPKEITLQRRVSPPWAKIIDFYPASYDLGAAQVGDEFVAFLQWTVESATRDHAAVLLVSWADSLRITPHLTGLIAAAREVDDARARQLAACPNPHTFSYGARCLTVKQLRKKMKCPKGSALTALPQEPTPRAYCGLPDGTFHGPFLTWRSDGDISSRGAFTHGKRSGTWTDYGERSKKLYRREYVDGAIHGRVAYYHPNGAISLMGHLVKGHREGRWTQYDNRGEELGRYELAAGSGNVKTFHRPGAQASETVYFRGKRHGQHITWHPNGKRAVKGTYIEDRPAGLWSHYDARGLFQRAECYRSSGGLRWETPVEAAARPERCSVTPRKR